MTVMRRRRTPEEKRKLEEEVEALKQEYAESMLTLLRDGRLERILEEQVGRAPKPSTKH
jgi:hypothetical protein